MKAASLGFWFWGFWSRNHGRQHGMGGRTTNGYYCASRLIQLKEVIMSKCWRKLRTEVLLIVDNAPIHTVPVVVAVNVSSFELLYHRLLSRISCIWLLVSWSQIPPAKQPFSKEWWDHMCCGEFTTFFRDENAMSEFVHWIVGLRTLTLRGRIWKYMKNIMLGESGNFFNNPRLRRAANVDVWVVQSMTACNLKSGSRVAIPVSLVI